MLLLCTDEDSHGDSEGLDVTTQDRSLLVNGCSSDKPSSRSPGIFWKELTSKKLTAVYLGNLKNIGWAE